MSITTDVESSNHVHGEVYSIQQYVIKFVSDLQQVGPWLSPGTPVSSTNKTVRHDITEILLKVALNTIIQTNLPFGIYTEMDFSLNMKTKQAPEKL